VVCQHSVATKRGTTTDDDNNIHTKTTTTTTTTTSCRFNFGGDSWFPSFYFSFFLPRQRMNDIENINRLSTKSKSSPFSFFLPANDRRHSKISIV